MDPEAQPTPATFVPLPQEPIRPTAAGAVARELLADSEPTLPPPAPGRDVGRHRLLEELGRGGMGIVYRAHDTRLGRDVALKVLRVAGSTDGELVERFQREARAAAALEHPRIIRVHDVDTLPDGSPYYTMELLTGQDMAHAIADGRLSARDAVEAVRQVAEGLSYAHEHGILHRDIKPQNIFLRRDPAASPKAESPTVLHGTPCPSGRVDALLLDFGLAKLAERDLASHAEGSRAQKSVQSLTRSGEIFGTPAYMSPEQTRGAKEVDARADVYSLGAALYHALAGEPPFRAPTLAELLEQVHTRDPEPPSGANGEVDGDLDTVCLKCLQKDPKDRYATAAALAEDLSRWLSGDAISARRIGFVGRVWRKSKRNRAVAIPVAILSSLLLVGLLTWGGVGLLDQLRYRRAIAETRELLGQEKLDDALRRVAEAQVLAPDDAGVKQLVAEIHVARGRKAVGEYDAAKARVEELEREEEVAQELPAEATDEQADAHRSARWSREREVREALRERGRTWSEAARPFLEALTHVPDCADARRALAELYWDEYLRAEAQRDRAEESRHMGLVVQFGGPEYEARARGEREVRVRFRLPAGVAARDLVSHLYVYVANEDPPVLVPVPCDPRTGEACGPPELGEWKPVALPEVSHPPLERVSATRWGSAFQLKPSGRNRVVLSPGSDAPEAVDFRATLPRGSYLLHLAPGQGVYETRYPFEVMREREWRETCNLAPDDAPPLPPATDSIPGATPSTYWIHMPEGPYRASGDRDAQMAPARRAAWIHVPEEEDFTELQVAGHRNNASIAFVARFEVTTGMYRAYLNDAAWHESYGVLNRCPREAMNATRETVFWVQDTETGWRPKDEAPWWTDDVPITCMSCEDAVDYCRWLTKRSGEMRWSFEFPTEDEWERAARGPDGRFLPWGDTFDAAFCRVRDSRVRQLRELRPEPVGLFPLDESPFGVRDVAGGMREWTATMTGRENQWRITKGGHWGASAALCRAAARACLGSGRTQGNIGMRLVARRAR